MLSGAEVLALKLASVGVTRADTNCRFITVGFHEHVAEKFG